MYSLRDSIITPDDLVTRLKEINQNAVAITDHGNLLSGVTLYKKLKENDLKLIIGCEFYICDDTSIKDKDNRYYHLIALCMNEAGRLNLNKLISISEHQDNKYYKPRIDFNILKEHSDGLIILSACMAGEISKCLESDNRDKAVETANRYKELFGNRYYLEIQSHNDEKQIKLNKQIYDLGQELDIKCVVTTDAHYAFEADKEYQNKYAFNGTYKEDGEAYIDCFLQSEDEVRDRLTYFDEGVVDQLITTTHEISERCNADMPLSAPIMPHVDVPPEYGSNVEWLRNICEEGFVTKLGIDFETRAVCDDLNQIEQELIDTYIERYEYEIDSLNRMGFIDYILLVYSYANVAKRRGIARGSGGGSLVCYLSNITNIDPIEHGLYFERFIDVGALDLLESGEITAKELKIPD